MLKKKIFLPIILVLALALTACTTDDGATDPDVDTTDVPVEEGIEEDDKVGDETPAVEEIPAADEDPALEVDSKNGYSDISVQPEQAFDIYMEKYPDTQVKELQLDKDMGAYVYKIEGFDAENEYELKIDSFTGDILEEDKDMEILEDDEKQAITREYVEKIVPLVDDALAESGENTKVEEWTLDFDDGIAELEVEIERDALDDIEYTYNIESGELLERDD